MEGYIAGVTNPLFQERSEWWDLLCLLDIPNETGTIVTSSSSTSSSSSSSSSTTLSRAAGLSRREESSFEVADMKFIAHVYGGVSEYVGEDWVKQQFRGYTHSILAHLQFVSEDLVKKENFGEKMKTSWEANVDRSNSLRGQLHKKTLESVSLERNPFEYWLPQCASLLTMLPSSQLKEGDEKSRATIPPMYAGKASSADIVMTDDLRHFDVDEDGAENDSDDDEYNDEEVGGYDILPKEEQEVAAEAIPELAHQEAKASSSSPISAPTATDFALLMTFIRRLRYEVNLKSRQDVEPIFRQLTLCIQDEASCQVLLYSLQEPYEGLSLIAMGLLHGNIVVHYHAFLILQRIQVYPSTRQAFEALNGFFHRAYLRMLRKYNDGSLLKEVIAVQERRKDSFKRSASDRSCS